MHKTFELCDDDRQPLATADDIPRFSVVADIRDADAFIAELRAFVHERLEAANGVQPPATVDETLERKAAALRAPTRWVPGETEIQRGRAVLLEAFEQPHNLPLAVFARLANKSRQQIYKDIEARRLLTLNVGRRGQRLPDWQLAAAPRQLTQAVLRRAAKLDGWTLYRALSDPLESLAGRSPVQAVTAESVDEVGRAVFNVLGLH